MEKYIPDTYMGQIYEEYNIQQQEVWEHDRDTTVGSSEVGACMRKTVFTKTGAKPDEHVKWGAMQRGNIIEDKWWEPSITNTLKGDMKFIYSGKDQKTFIKGALSATPDGLLINTPPDLLKELYDIDDIGDCINMECKSIDPRFNMKNLPKPINKMQVQAQMGIIRDDPTIPWMPRYSLLSYTGCSFFDDISEFPIAFSQEIYDVAQWRADQIMSYDDPMQAKPEGILAGGRECEDCAFERQCGAVNAALVPYEPRELSDEAFEKARILAIRLDSLKVSAKENKVIEEEIKEDIKELMRDGHTNQVERAGITIKYNKTKPQMRVNKKMISDAGLDPLDYSKATKEGDKLEVEID